MLLEQLQRLYGEGVAQQVETEAIFGFLEVVRFFKDPCSCFREDKSSQSFVKNTVGERIITFDARKKKCCVISSFLNNHLISFSLREQAGSHVYGNLKK